MEGTTLNRGQTQVRAFEGTAIPDDLRIFLRRGDDQLLIRGGVTVGDDALLLGQLGDDQILIDQLTVDDDLSVFATPGDDAVQIERSTIGDDARIFTGSGDDRVAVVSSTIEDRLTVITGGGDDVMLLDPNRVGGAVNINTNSGDDLLLLHGANPPNAAEFEDNVRLHGGGGEDTVEIDVGKVFAQDPRLNGFETEAAVNVVEFSPAEGLPFRNIPAGDPPGTGATDFKLEGASFTGGEVFFAGVPPFYASAPTSYGVNPGGQAEIVFDAPVQTARLFFVSGFGAFTATALDAAGNVVATANSNSPTFLGDPGNYVTLHGAAPIAKVVVSGGIIDNVAFA